MLYSRNKSCSKAEQKRRFRRKRTTFYRRKANAREPEKLHSAGGVYRLLQGKIRRVNSEKGEKIRWKRKKHIKMKRR